MRKTYGYFVILLMAFMLYIVPFGSSFLGVYAENIAQPGILDLSQYDVPLSSIDRYGRDSYSDYYQPVPMDTQAVQQQKFDMANEYIQQQKDIINKHKKEALGQLDQVIDEIAETKRKYDESRKSYRYDYYYPYPYPYYQNGYTNQEYHSTEIRKLYPFHDKKKSYPFPYHTAYMSYYPYMNILNIPGYINNTEMYYDGLDNDGDGFIDEGFHNGNVQIIIADSGLKKDDEWALYVNDEYMGINHEGMTRNWDLHLYPGTHRVTVIAHNLPDNSGSYSIVFRNANVVSGPPLTGRNIRSGESLEWLIKAR
jgi:hypothetical protein